MGPTGDLRVVQIHPTRQCNLRCLHCYSSSSPSVKESIAPEILFRAISDLADEGYNWVSFSGGEPTVYPALEETIDHAKGKNLNTMLVSNGILLDKSRLDYFAENLDLLVLSLDGVPDSHNRIRNNPKAFDMMYRRLEDIRERDIPFGFLFTLTQYNLDELVWAVDFAAREHAKLVQIHPLESMGSASTNLIDHVPDALESAYAFALKEELQKRLEGRVALQLDLIHSEALRLNPQRFYAQPTEVAATAPLGEILSPLIIQADGTVVPLQYGFPRAYALGNLYDARLKTIAREWKTQGSREFMRACSETYRRATSGEPRFLDWYGLLSEVAAELATRELETV